jgi:hypothetical protein
VLIRKVWRWRYLIILSASWGRIGVVFAQPAPIPVGRFQLGSVSAGQQTGLFLLDTATGCTWQLGAKPDTRRLTSIEMDGENLHWSRGSGAQQRLSQKIDESRLPEVQKTQLKQELHKTACGWTPVVLTPSSAESAVKPDATPARKR